MKKLGIIILVCFITLVSCREDPEVPIASLTVQDKVEAEWLEATLSGAVSANTKVENLYVQLCTNESFDDIVELNANFEEDIYKLLITKLIPQTTYYYRYRAENILSSYIDSTIYSFRTKDYINPIVTTDSITNVTGRKVNLFGTIAFDCEKQIIEQGFEYGIDKDNLIKAVCDSLEFTKQLLQLEFNTQYYYRAYATSEIGTGYGEIKTFKTCDVVKFGEIKISSITAYSADVEYSIISNGGMPILKQGFRYWKKETNDTAQVESMKVVNFQQLTKDQTYQLCAFAETEDSCFLSAIKEFTTKNGEISLKTLVTTDISYTSAKLNAHIEDQGGTFISQKGFVYSNTEKLPTTQNNKVVVLGDDPIYHCEINNLAQNTCYYVRAFATNDYGTYYGDATSFTTTYKTISFGPTKILSQSAQTITLEGNIISDGGSPIIEKGFCYSKSPNPTTKNTYTKIEDSGLGNYQIEIINLEQGTKYYVRPYAINSNDTFYGTEITISTQSGIPIFSAVTYSDVTSSSVRISGEIVSDGGSTIIERGFCYSQVANPTTSSSKILVDGTIGEMDAILKKLSRATKYHVRAYVTNSCGTYYSDEICITTQSGEIIVKTNNVSDILAESATLSGSVDSDGGATITMRGFCYSTSQNPTISNAKVEIPGALGEISATIKSLSANTKYYVRAFASNEYGTYYGGQIDFTTSDGIVLFSSLFATDITPSSVRISTLVTSDGNSPITERGFCYSTSPNPSISNDLCKTEGTLGDLKLVLSNLSNKTKYYVKAYAKNRVGTHYSDEISIITLSGEATVGITSVSDIKAESAKFVADVSSDGGSPITQRGFCYSTATGPTISSQKVVATGTIGAMSSSLDNLTKDTKYYVRAFATTTYGTIYGSETSFVSLDGVPEIGNVELSSLAQTSVTMMCSISNDGGTNIIERGFCYGTSSNPTISTSKQVVEGTIGEMSAVVSNLYSNTTYYVRAYTTTKFGTTYSQENSFHTINGVAAVSTSNVTNITPTTMTLNGNIISDGGVEIIEQGFCYSSEGTPTITDNKILAGSGVGSYSTTVNNLRQKTTYYVRAFATTSYMTSYGDIVNATTTYNPVIFGSISNDQITVTQAHIVTNITDDGGNEIQEVGICYGTNNAPTIEDGKLPLSTQISIGGTLTCLQPNTHYYARGYVINHTGTYYSNETEFTTLPTITGAVPGLFSISATKKVYFAQGNLRHFSDGYYFHTNQYDMMGEKAGTGKSSGIINWNDGYDYFTARNIKNDINIVNGGGLLSQWKLLTPEEYEYLRNVKHYYRHVYNVDGIILLPDGWVTPQNVTLDEDRISVGDWEILQSNGAVFLPCTGRWHDTQTNSYLANVGVVGCYACQGKNLESYDDWIEYSFLISTTGLGGVTSMKQSQYHMAGSTYSSIMSVRLVQEYKP